jgi:hypothetical protein
LTQKTGKALFFQDFLKELQDLPELLEKIKIKIFGFKYRNKQWLSEYSSNKTYRKYPGDTLNIGITYFLYNIAESIALFGSLKETFKEQWKKIFTIASFLIFDNKELMECSDFIKENITFQIGSLTSQSIYKLCTKINNTDYNIFLNKWHNFIKEKKYIAFDASYIPLIYGKNDLKEYENAKSNIYAEQKNLYLLYGQKSELPIFQTFYSGSLKDVSTVSDMLKEFNSIVGKSEITIVNDKDFYSQKNIESLIKLSTKFLIDVPFNNKDANSIYDKIFKKNELKVTTPIIRKCFESIKGITKEWEWYGKYKLYTHIFYDCFKGTQVEVNFRDEL